MRVVPVVVVAVFVLFLGVMMPAAPVFLVVMVSAMPALFIFVMMMSATTVFVVVVLLSVAMPAVVVFLAVVMSAMPALFVFVMVMSATAMLLLARKLVKLAFERCRVLHSGKYLLAVQKLPIGGYNRSLGVVFAHKFKRGCKFFTARNVGVAEHYASRALDLVVEKLAEIFHIYFAFVRVYNGGKRVDFAVL